LRYSELKVTASEFTPLPSLAPPTTTVTATDATDPSSLLAEDIAGLDLDTDIPYYNEEYSYEETYNSAYHTNENNETTSTTSQPLDREAILFVLQQNFPAYSPTALEEMFISCGNSLPATIDVLYKLENELYGVQQQQRWQQQQLHNSRQAAKKVEKVEFNADDFPSLGGEREGKSASTVVAFGANYAGRAKAAAHLPAPQPQRPPSTATATTAAVRGGSGSRSAAPIWQAQGEVEKFSTGISVAADYAEARAEARDHARARNVCFQNATQAYVHGNKALAKELGAKGRWHNEQMKMLHARAAEETFSKRNAATLAGANMMSASSGRSSGGSSAQPPTIDLHGLHVSEALLHLDRALENLQQQRVSTVRVVVGVGQHGKVPARLKTAVETHLHGTWRLKFREPYEGLLEVQLT
jgi:DNA-nicking Smr family endonuclease